MYFLEYFCHKFWLTKLITGKKIWGCKIKKNIFFKFQKDNEQLGEHNDREDKN